MNKAIVLRVTVALCATISFAGCSGSAPHKADKYCPAVLHTLPSSAPQDYNTALDDMNQLTTTIPSGTDQPLSARVLSVESALEAIGKAEIGIGQPNASQLSAYYAAASRLRTYCNG
jgi:hypothetical protein